MNYCKSTFMAILVLLWIAPMANAEERIAFVVKESMLLVQPNSSAQPLSITAIGDQVTVLGRKGGWYQIRTGDNTGWIKFISVRFQDGSQKGSAGLSETAKLLTQGTSPTLTAGVKGLQEEDLANARPDMAAVEQMETFAVTPEAVLRFAAEMER